MPPRQDVLSSRDVTSDRKKNESSTSNRRKEVTLKQATKEINRQSRRSGEADRTAVKQRRESENSE